MGKEISVSDFMHRKDIALKFILLSTILQLWNIPLLVYVSYLPLVV